MNRILNDTVQGDVVVIVPAKINSVGITRKFEADILGRPALLWTLETALECPDVSRVILMSNHPDIGNLARKRLSEEQNKRVTVVFDPPGDVPMDSKVYAILVDQHVPTDNPVVLFQPTCPLVRAKHLSAALALWRSQPLGVSVLSGRRCAKFRWFKARKGRRGEWVGYTTRDYDPGQRPPRQQREYIFLEDGAIYVSSAAVWYATRSRMGSGVMIYPLPEHYTVELDEPDDLIMVRAVAEYLFGVTDDPKEKKEIE